MTGQSVTGQKIGPYEVGEKLGEGGMGAVYRAHDTRLRRDVALKILAGSAPSDQSRLNFLREAQTASALNHSGIVTIHDIGEHAGEVYIVMEYVKGMSLKDLIPPGGMDPGNAVPLAMHMAEALGAAHAARIVHRDVKPGNIIVTAPGRMKILDFGLASYLVGNATGLDPPVDPSNDETGAHPVAVDGFAGTVAYASPEQSLRRPVDHRSDIFSLAVVLHEMLTGERPFHGTSAMDLLIEIRRGTPRRLRASHPNLPWSLEALILKMLEKRPEDRVQSMEMVRASLAAIDREIQHHEATAPQQIPVKNQPVVTRREDAAGGEIAMAVLQFRAVPQSEEAESFADGLTSETIQALGGVPRISVASRLAASRFEDGKTPLDVLARELKVNYVITGTVRHARERLRVLCELADTGSGSRVWSRTYDSGAGDPFDAQEEIARSIAAAVSGAVLIMNVPEEGLDAPTLVRRAHRALFAAYSRAGIYEAIGLFRQAIVAAPSYGPAYAYLGLALHQAVISGFTPNRDSDRAEALGSVERALQLAPADPEVLQNAGLVLVHQSQPERAIALLRRAVEIAEFNLIAWGYLALALGWTGAEKDMEEAQAIFARLLHATPGHRSVAYWLFFKGGICVRQARYDEALDCTRQSVERQPQFLVALLSHANALGLTGRYAEACEVVERVLKISPGLGEKQYTRELLDVVCTADRLRPHIAGLVAAGIFKGD